MYSKNKGLEYELLFIITIVILVVIVVAGVWQYVGLNIASERMSELKINTIAQIKNTLFLMQLAPVKTTACIPLKNCNKVGIHPKFVEIWGPANNYFKEDVYLSTSLIGNMDLYIHNDTSNSWDKIEGSNYYFTPCGSSTSPIFVCFEKVAKDKVYVFGR